EYCASGMNFRCTPLRRPFHVDAADALRSPRGRRQPTLASPPRTKIQLERALPSPFAAVPDVRLSGDDGPVVVAVPARAPPLALHLACRDRLLQSLLRLPRLPPLWLGAWRRCHVSKSRVG